MNIIAHNRPTIGTEEIQEVSEVLTKQWLIAGDSVAAFEKSMKEYIGMEHAVALNSGHAALHLSLLALSVGDGDEVILPSFSPADVLNAVSYVRAQPVLVDIGEDSFTLLPQAVKKAVSRKTRAIIVPHLFGFSAAVDELLALGVPLVEDCAQSIGSGYHGSPLGSFGEMSIFSFYATKMMTTGQGGMVMTNDLKKAELIRQLIDYNSPRKYMVRYNYPMTDIAAGMGVAQLKKLSQFVQRRKTISDRYREVLRKKAYRFWPNRVLETMNHFRFLVGFQSMSHREEARLKLLESGIETKSPIASYEVLHRLLGFSDRDFPYTSVMADTLLSLPVYPTLSDEEVERVTDALSRLL